MGTLRENDIVFACGRYMARSEARDWLAHGAFAEWHAPDVARKTRLQRAVDGPAIAVLVTEVEKLIACVKAWAALMNDFPELVDCGTPGAEEMERRVKECEGLTVQAMDVIPGIEPEMKPEPMAENQQSSAVPAETSMETKLKPKRRPDVTEPMKVTLRHAMEAAKSSGFGVSPKEAAEAIHFLRELGLIEIVAEDGASHE